jgi:Tfp pilus assembly protein PilV
VRNPIAAEEGTTLVEIMVALVILATAVVALTAGMGTVVLGSDRHRKAATADTVVRKYAEALKLAVRESSPDSWCRTSTTTTVIDGYTLQAVSDACPAAVSTTPQLQQVTITASMDDRASVVLKTTVRKP